MHRQDFVHAREIERHAAERRVQMTFKRRASAKGNDGHARLGTELHHLGHLLGGLGEHDGIGRLDLDPSERVGVLLPQRLVLRQAVAEACGKNCEESLFGFLRSLRSHFCYDRGHS